MSCLHFLRKLKLMHLLWPGLLVIVAGLCLYFTSPKIVANIMENNLYVRPGSKMFYSWKKSPSPTMMDIYLFNWTNPEHGHNASVRPSFVEVGPFRFREFKEKFNVVFNPENNTVSYKQKKVWFFDEYGTGVSLDTQITTLNTILVTMSHKMRRWNAFLKLASSVTFRALTPDIYVRKPARELLFDGYVDQLLATASGMGVSGLPRDGKFGFFHGKNDTSTDGWYNMDITKERKGALKMWNFSPDTPYYKGHCGRVFGTTGEMYPAQTERESVSFFSGDLCRNVPLDYNSDFDFFGLTTYKYVAGSRFLDNGTLYPENRCYCNGDCMPLGVVNVSSCRSGSPTYMSLPHFFNADPVYLRNVRGLKPNKEKHQFYIKMEPTLGLVLEASIRMQMNMHLKPIPLLPIVDDVPDVMFPILWFQASAGANASVAKKLKLLLNLPLILQIISYVLIASGTFMVLLGLYGRRKLRVENKTKSATSNKAPETEKFLNVTT